MVEEMGVYDGRSTPAKIFKSPFFIGGIIALLSVTIILSVVLTLPENVTCSADLADGRYFLVHSEGPEVSTSLPPLVCTSEGDRSVLITGSGFLNFNGNEPVVQVDSAIVTHELLSDSCSEVDVRGQEVKTCEKMNIVLPQQDTTEFQTPNVSVQWPERSSDTMKGSHATAEIDEGDEESACLKSTTSVVVRSPPPNVTDVWPPAMCVMTERVFNVSGDYFLRLSDGSQTHVFVNGNEVARENVTLDMCLPGPRVGDLSIERCQLINYRAYGVAVGLSNLTVENSQPAGCIGRTPGEYHVVNPSRAISASPAIACAGSTSLQVRLSGSNFLITDNNVSRVMFDGEEAIVVGHSGCVVLPTQFALHVTELCTDIDVELSPSSQAALAQPGGHQPVITVNPPFLAECEQTFSTGLLTLVPPPTLTSVVPSPTCFTGLDRSLVLTGTDFVLVGGVGGVLPNVTLGGYTGPAASMTAASCQTPTQFAPNVELCTEMTVVVPDMSPVGSISGGAVNVTVHNPAPLSCSSISTDSVLFAPPPLRLTQANPGAVCSSDPTKEVTVQGAGFIRVTGGSPQAPTVTVGLNVLSATFSNCTAAPYIGASAEICSTFVVNVDPASYPVGPLDVTITNPTISGIQVDCSLTESTILAITNAPSVTAAFPSTVCYEGGTVTIVGNEFQVTSSVILTKVTSSEQFTEPRITKTFVNSSAIDISIPLGLPAGFYTVTIDNGGSCSATSATAILEIRPIIIVFFVDPPVTYSNISLTATLYTSGLGQAPANIILHGPSNQIVTPAQTTTSVANENIIQLPAGLERGLWDIEVVAQTGCTGRSNDMFQVTDVLTVHVESVSPRFVYTAEGGAVQVTSLAPPPNGTTNFQATPRLYLSTGIQATEMRAVEFASETLLTAVVPAGVAVGTYNLIVVNPDASVGLLSDAIEIVAQPLPVILSAAPNAIVAAADVVVRGKNFDITGVNVSLACETPNVGVFGTTGNDKPVVPALIVQGSLSTTSVSISVDFGLLGPGTICLVILENLASGVSFTFSGLSKKDSSGNLADWFGNTRLSRVRAEHGAAELRVTDAARFMYVFGGRYDSSNVSTSLERARVGLFGDLGQFSEETSIRHGALPAPRTSFGLATSGRFVYIVGGTSTVSGDGLDTIWRSQLLDPLDVLRITPGIDVVAASASNAQGGTWTYKVASTYPASYAVNPGGESLPSEALTIQLPNIDPTSPVGLVIELTWPIDANADGYMLYRSPSANDNDLQLLAILPGQNNVSFLDDFFKTTDASVRPIPTGSLGRWYELPQKMTVPRKFAPARIVENPLVPGDFYLYVSGGLANSSTYPASFETLHLRQIGLDQVPQGPFISTAFSNTNGRAYSGIVTMEQGDFPTAIDNETAKIFFMWGQSSTTLNPHIQLGTLDSTSVDGSLALGNLPQPSGVAQAAGYGGCFFQASNFIYGYGGRQAGTIQSGGTAAQIQSFSGNDATLVATTAWNNEGTALSFSRADAACVQAGPFFYVLGGLTLDATSAVVVTNEVEFIPQ